MSDVSVSVTLTGAPHLPTDTLQALYRITGRSTVELREAIVGGRPVYTASLFGRDHLDVVPRLEKTIGYLDAQGIGFSLTESDDGEDAVIDRATLREMLEG